MATKQDRERDFHNAAFSDHRRERVLPVYSILNGSTKLYRSYIRSHAAGKRMLEYGCGSTALGSVLCTDASEIVAIDISDVAVQQATERAAANGIRASYHVMDAESLQFPDQSFDLICSAAVLHHLDLRKAYSEIARTLRPDGHAIFIEPLGHNPIINAYRRLTPSLRTPDEHPLLTSDLRLAHDFFDGVEIHYFSLTTFMAIPLRRTRLFWPVLRGLERLDNALFAAVPFLRKHAWQIVLILSRPKTQAARQGRPASAYSRA